MLIKEYRIPLPLTVEEYRIAQLYMIAKKSREESKGAGSGVEILINEPYEGGPGGTGQYTKKIYHVGSHLPGWFKSLLPKSALTVEEEAWNAYPYTKTRYTCPFVEKFSLEIETYYFADNGFQDNVFGLTDGEMRNRIVDLIDVVKDQVYGADYVKEEDPKFYLSQKTGRGPLSDDWLEEYWSECKGKDMPTTTGKALMCAYKLCRVEFRYWGMQTKLEKFIHDVALRKTMVRAHRQAWAWQDEWHGLTMEDIREIERKTMEALKAKMDPDSGSGVSEDMSNDDRSGVSGSNGVGIEEPNSHKTLAKTLGSIEKHEDIVSPPTVRKTEMRDSEGSPQIDPRVRRWSKTSVKAALPSPSGSNQGLDIQLANWRMEFIRRDSGSGSDEEFFDCQVASGMPIINYDDNGENSSLAKWSSMDLLAEEEPETASPTTAPDRHDSIFSTHYLQRVASERGARGGIGRVVAECYHPDSPLAHPVCPTSILILVLHAGSVLDANVDLAAKKSDVTTFRGAFESVMRQHYPAMVGHVAVRLVPCLSVCTEALAILSSLSPYSFDVSPSMPDAPQVTHDSIPIGAIPLFATSSAEYEDAVSRTVNACNSAYQEFIRCPEGRGFTGQVVFVGDSVGSLLAYDALCRPGHYSSRHDSENSILDTEFDFQEVDKHLSAPANRRRSSSTSEQSHCKLDMEVSDLFMFGSPLAMVLAYRKVLADDKTAAVPKPGSTQVYNLFHPTDPVSARLEPLLSARFSVLPPVNVARYQKYPLGDGQPYHLLEIIQANSEVFSESLSAAPPSGVHLRRMSELSIQSTISGISDALPLHAINTITQRWWGNKRLDYALYCPEGLANFPTNALPHLFHASYWESCDVIAFILRQVGRFEIPLVNQPDKEPYSFSPSQPREKWNKKRTSVKLKNMTANHRANDVIIKEGQPQKLVARFMYGPLDVIALTGEKVDIYVMKDAPAGEWSCLATEVTDKAGRITYVIPSEQALGYGMYPIKMIVRGDHTSVDSYMAVIPPRTECVVFSIDGSFTASMSVSGRDPKVRAGAVDVVRHWQELGYLIIYVTGRPDMQQQKVVSWLSQHNFPHGLISFADGLSTDPLGHKTDYLRSLMADHGVLIHAAYGSSKDITVYMNIGLKERQIYIIGKVSKKHHSQCTVLCEGYAAHLTLLTAHGGSRPAQGNARMVIPRGYFGLPGQNASLRRRRSAKRATSYPLPDGPHTPTQPPLSAPVQRL